MDISMQNNNPVISVGMLTYNRKQYLERSIGSILSQDFSNFEVIIVDNGSTDGSGLICDTYAEKDPRIRVIYKQRGNIGSGRNEVVKAAKGMYVAFIDDDDYALPDMLSFLYGLITEYNADISFCGSYKDISGMGVSPNFIFDHRGLLTPREAVIQLLERKIVNAATPTKLFRKNILDAFPFDEDKHYEDIFITYKLFASANQVAIHELPKYYFVRHGSNNSQFTTNDHLLSPSQLDEYFDAYRERTTWLIERFPDISEIVMYSQWSFLISMYHKIIVNQISGCDRQLEYILKILTPSIDAFEKSPYCKPFEHEYLQRYFV
jgi:glycosyltransferase involved in cell wall biosynthesis